MTPTATAAAAWITNLQIKSPMVKKTLLAAIAAIGVASGSVNAEMKSNQVGDWQVGAGTNKEGYARHCQENGLLDRRGSA